MVAARPLLTVILAVRGNRVDLLDINHFGKIGLPDGCRGLVHRVANLAIAVFVDGTS